MDQVVTVQIEGNVPWRAFRDPSTRMWIGVCEPLKLTARGTSWADLANDIDDILQTLFIDLIQEGRIAFESFLKQHGWTPVGPIPQSVESLRFDIPMPIEHVAHAGAS